MLLTTEAEYVMETPASKEGIWLKTFIKEIIGSDISPLTIKADNQGTISLAKDNRFHAQTKHVDLQYHFVCEVVKDGKVRMQYIPTSKNVSNIFTKALPRPKFTKFVGMLGLAMMKK